jgi:hypothetical protein
MFSSPSRPDGVRLFIKIPLYQKHSAIWSNRMAKPFVPKVHWNPRWGRSATQSGRLGARTHARKGRTRPRGQWATGFRFLFPGGRRSCFGRRSWDRSINSFKNGGTSKPFELHSNRIRSTNSCETSRQMPETVLKAASKRSATTASLSTNGCGLKVVLGDQRPFAWFGSGFGALSCDV